MRIKRTVDVPTLHSPINKGKKFNGGFLRSY